MEPRNTLIVKKVEYENWTLYGDCLNLKGELTLDDLSKISKIKKLRVIQPWNYMPSNKVWFELNEKIFKIKPNTKLHIWADTIKSDFLFLSEMTNVRNLDLNQVKFKNKETISLMKGLKSLKLVNGNLKNLVSLKSLENLESLELARIRGLNDISFISELKNLRKLRVISQKQIDTLPNFQNNGKLTKVFLRNLQNLREVNNLEQIINLEELDFYELKREIEPEQFYFLRNCKKLKSLNGRFNTKEKRNRFESLKNDIFK